MVRILVGNNLTSMSQKCKLKEGEERKKREKFKHTYRAEGCAPNC